MAAPTLQRAESGVESKGHHSNPTLVYTDGTRYKGDVYNALPWYWQLKRKRWFRSRVLKKDPAEWDADEFEIITQHPRLYRLKAGWAFESFFAVMVIFNTLLMGAKVDANDPDSGGFTFAEHAFCTFFLAEWILSVFIEGPLWLTQGTTVFETALVFIGGILPVWLLPGTGTTGGIWENMGGVFTIFRCLRIFRIYRLLRKAKQKDLWMLVIGMMASFKSFFWAMVLLTSFIWVSAIFVRFVAGADLILEKDPDGELRYYFGNVGAVMWWLFSCYTGGVSWEYHVKIIMAIAPHYWLYFSFFICLGTFVLLNLITAVIVEHAIDNSHQEAEHEADEAMKSRGKTIDRILEVFKECDKNGDGHVDRKEFEDMCQGKQMQRLQRILHMDEDGGDLLELFDLIDLDGSGVCTLAEYKETLFKLLNPPDSKDILSILITNKKSALKVEELISKNPLAASAATSAADGQLRTFTTQLEGKIDTLNVKIGLIEQQAAQNSDAISSMHGEIGELRQLCSSRLAQAAPLAPMPKAVMRNGRVVDGCCSGSFISAGSQAFVRRP